MNLLQPQQPRLAAIAPLPDLDDSLILDTDSYKLCHWRHYPKGMTNMLGYFESRGGRFQTCTLFGLQYLKHRYLSKPITLEQVRAAAAFAPRHGLPFNQPGWEHVVRKHGGRPPIRIRAIPEGLVVPTHNVLYTVESTDAEVPWLGSHFETMLVRLWAPSTIATTSREMAKTQKKYLDITSDDPDRTHLYAVHDFGGRGVTCREQARVAGGAHLLSFRGSDTMEGIRFDNHYYYADMAGFSIPATEHSVMTLRGPEGEMPTVESYIQKELALRELPAGVPKLAACVADSYDVYEFTHQVTSGRLREMIERSGGKFVERPDSGNPLEVLPEVLEIAARNLADDVVVNSKGFRVLPPYFGFIQGDSVDIQTHEQILRMLVERGWCVSNLAYGSGGGLLQKWNRDDQKWKLAASAATVDGKPVRVHKDPITDPDKRSKAGRLDLIQKDDGSFETIELEPWRTAHPRSVMVTVYENGELYNDVTLDECRARMAI